MANNIKYLDQKGLKTFHDATGWVTIKLDVGQSIKHYTHSPVKFHSVGKVYINGIEKKITPIVEEMLWPDTIIKNDETPMTISVFVNEYNQFIQHEFKTDKLTLPGATSQVVLGDGSLKGLDNLVVGNAKNIKIIKDVKEGLILPSSTPTKIPLLGIYGALDYNTPRKIDDVFLNVNNEGQNEFHVTTDLHVSGNIYGNVIVSKDDDSSVLYLTGCNASNILHKSYRVGTGQPEDLKENIYMYYNGANNLYSPNLHTRYLYIEGGNENKVLQGNGQPILKTDLVVGGADQVKISNISIPTDLVGLTYPLLGSLDGGSLDDTYKSLVNLNEYVFYSIIKDPLSNTISKTLIVADGYDEENQLLRGTIYGNLDGVATKADCLKTKTHKSYSTPQGTYPILVKAGNNYYDDKDEYITTVSSGDVYLKRLTGEEITTLYALQIKIAKDIQNPNKGYDDVASQEWVSAAIDKKINNLIASEEDIVKIFTNKTNNNTNTTT